MQLLKQTLCTAIALAALNSRSQTPGSVDTGFNTYDTGYYRGDSGANGIFSMARQPDGKVLVGVASLKRYFFDGSADANFTTGAAAGLPSPSIDKILVQSDGKILVSGHFTTFNGSAAVGIVRLSAAGVVDNTFSSGTGITGGYGLDMVQQPDGKVVVVGSFTGYNGNACGRIVRLNTDGSYDATFATGTGFTSQVRAIARQSNGSFLVGGTFSAYNGTNRLGMARISSSGALDATYDPGGGNVRDIAIRSDGMAMVSGGFQNIGGLARPGVARLYLNGSADPTFNAGSGPDNDVWTVAQTGSGVLIGGAFTSINGQSRPRLARLTDTGALDLTFVVNDGADERVTDIVEEIGGTAIFIGAFFRYNGSLRPAIARVSTNGSVDPTFFAPSGITKSDLYYQDSGVRCMAVQNDGKIVVGGAFRGFNGTPATSLFRMNANGTFDPSFAVTSYTGQWEDYLYHSLRAVAVLPDGKVLAVGNGLVNGSASNGICRFTSAGLVDNSFLSGSGFSGEVFAMVVQPDGRILLAGNMTSYNGAACARVVRLNADGTLDTGFNAGTGPNGLVYTLALLSDGSAVVGGSFTQVNGSTKGGLARLLPNGALDPVFPSGSGISGNTWSSSTPAVMTLAALPDDRVLVGGNFLQINGTSRGCIARLLTTGAVDASFDPGAGTDLPVHCMYPQPDGKVVIGGEFWSFGMPVQSRYKFARLNNDGSLDQNYPVQYAPYAGSVNVLIPLGNGQVLAGGSFVVLNGVGRNRLTRLNGGDVFVRVSPKVFLQGPYDGGTQSMSDDLRSSSLLPNIEPYTALGYTHVAGGGGGSVSPAVLSISGTDAIVDHVVVELRPAANPATVAATRTALVQRDGDVVAMDGTSPVTLYAPPGTYHVAIRHRNHLGVMSSTPLSLTTTTTTVDFTQPGTSTYGLNAQVSIGTRMAMWAGDVNRDGLVKYTGANNDRDAVLVAVGGTTPNNAITGYRPEDVTLDGTVKYVGLGNDRDAILSTIGGTTPGNVRQQQLP